MDNPPGNVGEIAYPRLLFAEVQRFHKPFMWVLAALVGGIPAALIIYARVSNPRLYLTFVVAVLAICMIFPAMVIFIGLRVIVTSDQICLDFFPLRRKIIRTSEIESASAETYHPFKEFGGWGWRQSLRDATWAYTVSGDRGVRLRLRNGKRFMIGSLRADELGEAITTAMGIAEGTTVLTTSDAPGKSGG